MFKGKGRSKVDDQILCFIVILQHVAFECYSFGDFGICIKLNFLSAFESYHFLSARKVLPKLEVYFWSALA